MSKRLKFDVISGANGRHQEMGIGKYVEILTRSFIYIYIQSNMKADSLVNWAHTHLQRRIVAVELELPSQI